MRERNPAAAPKTTAERGYGGPWQRNRKRFLELNPLCLYCRRQGREVLSTLVDHNPPHLGDMTKFWDTATWTPCCDPCHGYVTPIYDGGGGNAIRPRDGVYVAPAPGEVEIG